VGFFLASFLFLSFCYFFFRFLSSFFLLMAIFSRLPWGTTGGLSFVDDDRLLLATDGVVNHDPIPVFLIHMAAQRIAGVAVVDI